MSIIAKYKFNQNIYANFIPEFNTQFTVYTITDEIDTDGFTIRTIESDSLPTLMRFGSTDTSGNGDYSKQNSLLEILEINTFNITNMSLMFYRCENLLSINCDFNTINVTNMYGMFYNCYSLTSLDLSSFNTSKIVDMGNVFYNCSSLTSLNVSSFNTEKVASMSAMFYNCSSLTSLDTSNFNTEKVTSMGWMFYNCSSLTSLDVSNFNTENVTGMQNVFNGCSLLISLDISNFNTENVTTMYAMFNNCSSLVSLDISNFNTQNVADMSSMFQNCSSLTSLDISNFNTENVTSMQNMFRNCSSLTSLDASNFNTENVTDTIQMFNGCSSLTSLDISNFNTEKITNMQSMFGSCSKLTSLDVSNFNTKNVKNMSYIFDGCSKLTSLDISNFNTEKVGHMGYMFRNCSSLISLDVSNFNTENVTNMAQMFYTCSSLTSLDVSNFNTENVTDAGWMLRDCFNLIDIGAIYCNSSTINKIVNLLTTNTTIWYSEDEVNVEDLDILENITYKPYKENRISYDGIPLRSLPNGVKDEINVLTGEYVQRIGEVVLDGSETIEQYNSNLIEVYKVLPTTNQKINGNAITSNGYTVADNFNWGNDKSISYHPNVQCFYIRDYNETAETLKEKLSKNPVTVHYQLAEPIIRQLDPQSLTPYQDGYISMEAEVNYPSFIYSLPSTNTFYIPKIKNMTQYTLKYPVGSGTMTIGNIQYNITSDSMLFTTPIEITDDKNSLIFETDDNLTDIMILEGDYSNREVKYFTGLNSVINPVIIVTNSLTGDSVEYRGDSDIALYSLPNKMSDKLDILTGYLVRVTGIRSYQDGDYELDNVFTDGVNTVYKLDSPLLYKNINFPTVTLNGYGMIQMSSDELTPQFNYRALSNNYYPLELLEPNSTYTLIGEAQANTLFTLGGTYLGNYEGGKVVVNLGSVTEKSLKFNNDIGLENFMLVKGDATESTLPFYEGIKSVEDVTFTIKGYDEQENNFILGDSIILRKCGEVYDAVDLIAHKLTKRLNEIDLTGLEYWSVETSKRVDSEYQLFSLSVTSAKDSKNATIYCDKLPHNYLATSNNNQECIYFENNKLYLCVKKLTIGGDSVNALKTWLTKDNIKIIYPSISNVVLDLDVVWEVDPPLSYETQTEFDTTVALGTLKPMLAITVATTTLEDIVSTLETQNAKLEEENVATMLALTGIYETMVVPTITSEASTYNLSDGKDGTKVTGMSISPMGMIYAKLVNKGFRTIEQVPAHLQAEVMYVLRGGE